MIVVEKEKSIGGYQKKFFQLSDTEDFLPVIWWKNEPKTLWRNKGLEVESWRDLMENLLHP